MNLLSLLFGQSASDPNNLPDDLAPQGSDQMDLPVTGNRPPDFSTDEPIDMSSRPLGNSGTVDKIRAANLKTEIPRGLFGLKGIPQNLLGILGDALLTQGDKDPRYAPWKKEQELAKAMAGFTENPLEALERGSMISPAFGQKGWDQYSTNQNRAENNKSLAAQREEAVRKMQAARIADARNRAARMFSQAKTPAELEIIKAAIKGQAKRDAFDIADLGYDLDGLDITSAKLLASQDMTVNQQRSLAERVDRGDVQERQGDRRLDISQQSADAGDVRAAAADRNSKKSPAGRAASKETLSDVKKGVMDRISDGTASESDYKKADMMKLDYDVRDRRAARKRGGAPSGKPAGKTFIYRNGKKIYQ